MTTNNTNKQIVKHINALHLWFKDNKPLLSKELEMESRKLNYTYNFFEKLLKVNDLPTRKARTLSNMFKGKGTQTPFVLEALMQLAEVLGIDLEKDKEKFKFKTYPELKKGKVNLCLNDKHSSSKTKFHSTRNFKMNVDFLKNDSETYGSITKLIITESENSIQGLMNGGLGGKAPEGWHEKIFEFLKKRHKSLNPVTFELIIICREEDFENTSDVAYLKRKLALIKKHGLDKRFLVYLSIQNHIWLSPDYLLIDRKYLVFNWPTTLDKTISADRTQKGLLISNSFEVIQYFKDFFEKIVLTRDKCMLAEDYLKSRLLW